MDVLRVGQLVCFEAHSRESVFAEINIKRFYSGLRTDFERLTCKAAGLRLTGPFTIYHGCDSTVAGRLMPTSPDFALNPAAEGTPSSILSVFAARLREGPGSARWRRLSLEICYFSGNYGTRLHFNLISRVYIRRDCRCLFYNRVMYSTAPTQRAHIPQIRALCRPAD
jgi:hypothetical protein